MGLRTQGLKKSHLLYCLFPRVGKVCTKIPVNLEVNWSYNVMLESHI